MYEKKLDRVYGCVTSVSWMLDCFTRVKPHKCTTPVAFRIDGRKALGNWDGKGYRVDICTAVHSICMPWEAIDQGKSFPNLREAKKYITRWKRAAEEQQTLSPRIER